jgi:hypothetical protein
MCCQEDHRERACCEKPHRLRDRPQECTPEEVRECHGEGKEHPCVAKGEPA